ncbi:MAG: PEP-CTERM sorting domain-containing protein [Cyanobacteriota bacterium]|nr:PEP-CTERM sorting domain-containing protein [Cyanobacteriota bacterium]
MKLHNSLTGISLIATAAIGLSTAPAQAFNFNTGEKLGTCDVLVDNVTKPLFKAFIDETDDVSTCTTEDGITLSATQPGDGFLQGKKVDDIVGIGVSVPDPGPVPGEIQFGEELVAELGTASIIESISLGFLYLDGEFHDLVNEIAKIEAKGADGTSKMATLTVTGETTAEWLVDGVAMDSVINIDPSVEPEGGAYEISNPFGDDFLVSSLLFTAPDQPGIEKPRDSDYSLLSIDATAPGDTGGPTVPEPTTLLGLGVVGGLMASARRRKSSR